MYIREPFPYTRLKIREALGLEAKFTRLGLWETLRRVVHDGCSLSRYGDGELSYFLKGHSLPFQPYRSDLGERLWRAILTPREGVLTCFNNQARDRDFKVEIEFSAMGDGGKATTASPYRTIKKRWHKQRTYLERWIRIARRTDIRVFGDASCLHIAAYAEEHKNAHFDEVKEDFRCLFRDRRILFVCPQQPLAGDSFQALEPRLRQIGLRDAQYILIPNVDAAAVEDDIRRQIAAKSGYDDIFIQAGPLATVLAYELAGTVDGRVVDAGALNNAVPFFTEESATTPA